MGATAERTARRVQINLNFTSTFRFLSDGGTSPHGKVMDSVDPEILVVRVHCPREFRQRPVDSSAAPAVADPAGTAHWRTENLVIQ